MFLGTLALFLATTYGGVRSSDSEVVYQAAESFVSSGRLEVRTPVEGWEEFGVAPGLDGRRYSIFGPLQPILMSPWIVAARALEPTGWYRLLPRLPVSHYAPGGKEALLSGAGPVDPASHARRTFVALFNVLVGALCVLVFWEITARLDYSLVSRVLTTSFLAAGSLLWPYSRTLFSEPLALLFVLLSFLMLIGGLGAPRKGASRAVLLGGFCLGLASATHVTAALFIPFLGVYTAASRPRGSRTRSLGWFGLGAGVVLAALMAFNMARFGDPFETGRYVRPELIDELGYGRWVNPLRGTLGLLVSSGKGLVLYCPAVILGVLSWPQFHRRQPLLAVTLATAVVARIVFLAARSDWHGGFCLGPRYLLLAVPLLLLPVGAAVDAWIREGRTGRLAALAIGLLLCVSQQIYFVLSDVFLFFRRVRLEEALQFRDALAHDRLYWDWSLSPLFRLLEFPPQSALRQSLEISAHQHWVLLCALAAAVVSLGVFKVTKRHLGSRLPGLGAAELHRGIATLLVAITVAVMGQCLTFEFTNFDDNTYVTINESVKSGITRDGLVWALTTGHMSIWHPLTWISHMLDCQMWGLDAGGHHLTSLLLHVASVVVLFRMLVFTLGRPWCAGAVALIFAIHPLHVESVMWIAERKDVLSTLFSLLALYAYAKWVKTPSTAGYLRVTVFFLLGLLAKPMAVTIPCVMLLMDWWPLRRFEIAAATRKKRASLAWSFIAEKLPWFGLAAAISLITYRVMAGQGTIASLEELPLAVRLGNVPLAYVHYLAKAVWPFGLSVFYPYPPPAPLWQVLAASGLLVAITGAALRWSRTAPFLIVGWLWFLGALVPVIGVIQQAQHLIADRYTYFPLIGLAISIVWGAAALIRRRPRAGKAIGMGAGVALTAMALVASRQVSFWHDSISLFEHALACDEENHVAHNNLGAAYSVANHWERSVYHFSEALRIEPYYFRKDLPALKRYLARANGQLAWEVAQRGETERAIGLYREANDLIGGMPDYHYNAGNLSMAREDWESAAREYRAALELEPGYPDAGNNLGLCLMRTGRAEEAREIFAGQLASDPTDLKAVYNLACVAAWEGDASEAVAWLERAMRQGFADWALVRQDADLDGIRESRAFRELLERVERQTR